MKRLLTFGFFSLLCACVSEPSKMYLPPPDGLPPEPAPRSYQPPPTAAPDKPALNLVELQNQLGLGRSAQDLGFDERGFDGCQWNYKNEDGKCGPRYFSVVHFRLLCRDSVETVQTVATNFKPLAGRMQWRLAGAIGNTETDSQGFGQVQSVSQRSVKGQRFILVLGSKSLGLEVGEVSQIILPGNWCDAVSAANGIPPFLVGGK